MKLIINVLILSIALSCNAQEVIDLSNHENLNYYLANIYIDEIERYSLYDNTLYVTVFPLSDFKKTSENSSIDGHEIQTSFLITLSEDGEYISSRLYKVGSFINPKIISITGQDYPSFQIEIESGSLNDREKSKFNIQ